MPQTYAFTALSIGAAAAMAKMKVENRAGFCSQLSTGRGGPAHLGAFWRSPSEHWRVEAYVENVFDKEYIDDMNALAGVAYAYCTTRMPPWAGVKGGVSV